MRRTHWNRSGRTSEQLSYLYVLSIAAHRASMKELDEKATAQLVRIGEGSPEFHLFMGKAHLNLEQYDLPLPISRLRPRRIPT